jgi:hypothetical protein
LLLLLALHGCSLLEQTALGEPLATKEMCKHYKAWSQVVSEPPLQQALAFFSRHHSKWGNSRYLSVADYSLPSTEQRFYLLDFETGEVVSEHVSHGMGVKGPNGFVGDEKNDAMLDRCQYLGSRTNLTRVGFFMTDQLYFSPSHDEQKKMKHWPDLAIEGQTSRVNGLRLMGLSRSNKEALARGVVMHEATYNDSRKMGRSHGCPAFRPQRGAPIMEAIAGGSLFYSYAPQCTDLSLAPLSQIPGWEETCADQR